VGRPAQQTVVLAKSTKLKHGTKSRRTLCYGDSTPYPRQVRMRMSAALEVGALEMEEDGDIAMNTATICFFYSAVEPDSLMAILRQ